MAAEPSFFDLLRTLQALRTWTAPQLRGLVAAARALALHLPAPGTAYHHALEMGHLLDQALGSRSNLRLRAAAECTSAQARIHAIQGYVLHAFAGLAVAVELWRLNDTRYVGRLSDALHQMKRAVEVSDKPEALSEILGAAYQRMQTAPSVAVHDLQIDPVAGGGAAC